MIAKDYTAAEKFHLRYGNLQVSRYRHELSGPRQGAFTDTTEIADCFGLSDPHVRRLLRLAYLAPDIVRKLCGKKNSG